MKTERRESVCASVLPPEPSLSYPVRMFARELKVARGNEQPAPNKTNNPEGPPTRMNINAYTIEANMPTAFARCPVLSFSTTSLDTESNNTKPLLMKNQGEKTLIPPGRFRATAIT